MSRYTCLQMTNGILTFGNKVDVVACNTESAARQAAEYFDSCHGGNLWEDQIIHVFDLGHTEVLARYEVTPQESKYWQPERQ